MKNKQILFKKLVYLLNKFGYFEEAQNVKVLIASHHAIQVSFDQVLPQRDPRFGPVDPIVLTADNEDDMVELLAGYIDSAEHALEIVPKDVHMRIFIFAYKAVLNILRSTDVLPQKGSVTNTELVGHYSKGSQHFQINWEIIRK